MAVTDAFTDANGVLLPDHNANWSAFAPSSFNSCKIHTNAAADNGACANRYSGRVWSNDQYSQGVVVALTDSFLMVAVRCAATDTKTFYGAGINPGLTGNNRYLIWKYVAASYTTLATHGSQDMATSDIVKLSVTGTSLSLSVNGLVILGPTTDTDIASGEPGLGMAHFGATGPFLDTWEGDDVGSLTTEYVAPIVQQFQGGGKMIGLRYV